MEKYIIKDISIVNEGIVFGSSVLIINDRIDRIGRFEDLKIGELEYWRIIDGKGKFLLPGIIDDQVHFREPGLTHKGDIESESRAAVAGGITSYMEMPNTIPQATTVEEIEKKFEIAKKNSFANYSFYIGATNDNIDELLKADYRRICGIKVFMGSSTGNMLVDKNESLINIFSKCKALIATHCEDEAIIKNNISDYKSKFGDEIDFKYHSEIRSSKACLKSSMLAVDLAKKYNSRLHVLHISSKEEAEMFENKDELKDKRITSEVCVHHLWFENNDYHKKKGFIKWNPSVKYESDKNALIKALKEKKIDVVATDHAPHTLEEKKRNYFDCPSGGPMVQHSLVSMLELFKKDIFSLNEVVEKMCHNPAILFKIKDRGFIRENYFADLVIVDLNKDWVVTEENLLYKCKWSPMTNQKYSSTVTHTFVNGKLVYENGMIDENVRGMELEFGER